jgi:hypothetical protein
MLHIGIFIVWLPTVLVARNLTADFRSKDFWKAALRACPPWMKYLVYACSGYAILNFIVFMAAGPPKGGSGPMNAAEIRGFSGHWMAFYSAAMAVLYSAAHAKNRDAARRCPMGTPSAHLLSSAINAANMLLSHHSLLGRALRRD